MLAEPADREANEREANRPREEASSRARLAHHTLEESGTQRPESGEKKGKNVEVRRESPAPEPVGVIQESLMVDLRQRTVAVNPVRRHRRRARNHEALPGE